MTTPEADLVPGHWNRLDYGRANHEAGHAVAAVVLGIPIDSARIDEPDADVAGLVATRPVWTQVGLRDHIVATMAGPPRRGTGASVASGPLRWGGRGHRRHVGLGSRSR